MDEQQNYLVMSASRETERAKILYRFYLIVEPTPIHDDLAAEFGLADA